jgi:hypothetical protein
MGLRFRKSVNLGGGFRVNLSKTGVGYSWGVKGLRVTRTAKGTTRTTASIPGTGISYVTETSGKRGRQANPFDEVGGETGKAPSFVGVAFWTTLILGFFYQPLFLFAAAFGSVALWRLLKGKGGAADV